MKIKHILTDSYYELIKKGEKYIVLWEDSEVSYTAEEIMNYIYLGLWEVVK